jgi:hypothetical protein
LLLDVSPNSRVLMFTAGVSLATGIAFGLFPPSHRRASI